MKKLSNIIMMTMVMTVLFSSCSKTNELDHCYVIEQEIESQEELIRRMMVLYISPNTDPDIWAQLNVRMMEARAKLSELEIERSEICG